nr:aminotransferase class I/II-fold pyridoxal phosphate-dependent enzyme [Bacillus mediterraneensis]
MDQKRTPLYDCIVKHAAGAPVSFHVPGHKYGEIIPDRAQKYFRELLKMDATELTGLDDLHSPEGPILEAQGLLKRLYGTEQSYFLVNGSTAGNLAMILATVKENDIVLVQRNSHKSIMNGIRMAKAHPVFLSPETQHGGTVAGGVALQTVEAALEKYPEAKAIILTYPNYYGMVNDLGAIVTTAHARKIPVLVDEAHGVHFTLGQPFPASAVSLGADCIVQSAHKTLPAMTMGAYLHITSKRISITAVESWLQTLQSSSPSYPIMASLDLARSYLGTYTQRDLEELIQRISKFRMEAADVKGLEVLPLDGGDPLKLTIKPNGGQSGYELQARLEEEGIYGELADPYHVLLVLPLLKKENRWRFAEAIEKIRAAATKLNPASKVQQLQPFQQKPFISMAIPYQEMEEMEKTAVALEEAEGEVCAEMVIPYPPGIPLLMPGIRIGREELAQLRLLLDNGAKIQGGSLLGKGLLTIFK